ncbi:asparagine synthase-related protein [Haladaptatus sp. DJG-WS-42]|uniref:asparagine synthase-related protein n=1 Tax=Haladaptatus sp. DJG-WS-42 TaxID=3120516 RepID=UPI0030D35140
MESAVDSVRFFEDYDVRIEWMNEETAIGYSGFADYPLTRVETDSESVVLEGDLYGQADIESVLSYVGRLATNNRHEELSEWVREIDGDFLIIVYDKTREEIHVINDVFARLPVFYATVGDALVVSRELKFVRTFAAESGTPLVLNQLGAAQQLAFGYCLGDQTLFAGVRCLPPGSHLSIADSFHLDRTYQHNFDGRNHADKTVEENGATLASLFKTAVRNRHRPDATTVLSLSGGLDSRAVAGACIATRTPFTTATFDTGSDTESDDARVARMITDSLGVDWHSYKTQTTDDARDRLLDMKQGMNYLGMAFILSFFDQLREDFPQATYLTGDGGDKVLVDLTPVKSLSSTEALVEYIIEANSRIPLDEAAAIANVTPASIVESVEDRLASYPEQQFAQKYVHFLIRERGINFLNHGEDRNRYFFWSVSPFYALPVFEYAMNCPDEQKQGQALYKAFLGEFAPELIDIEYPNFGAPITSLEYRAKRFVFDVLSRYPSLRHTVVKQMKDNAIANSAVTAKIDAQRSTANLDPLDTDAIGAVTANPGAYRLIELNFLLTLTTIVSEMRTVTKPSVTGSPADD